MFGYPFYNVIFTKDPFDHSLLNTNEPVFPSDQFQLLEQKQDVPKVQEGTSVYYIFPIPPEQQPKVNNFVKQKSRKYKKRNDDDYKPNQRPKIFKGIAKQKQDRNLIPNNVHHLLAFVQKQFKSSYLVQKIFKEINNNPKYTVSRFYNYQKMLRSKVNNYVNEQAMKIITKINSFDYSEYQERQQAFYCLASRILIKKFLKTQAILMILNSKKVRRENIIDHLRVQRYLYENVRTIDSF